MKKINKKAFSSLEVLLTSTLFILLLTTLIGAFLYGQEANYLAGNRNRAIMLAQEGLEVVKNIKEVDFSNLNTGTYGLIIDNNKWQLSESINTNNFFTRKINISNIDDNRKEIEVEVSWLQNRQRNGLVILKTILTNWQKTIEIISNWLNPNYLTDIALSGNQPSLKVQTINNYAYIIRPLANPNFIILDISDQFNPEIVGSLGINPERPSNLFVLNNHAYLVDSQRGNLIAIDISNPTSLSIDNIYNSPGNTRANGVYINNNFAYFTRENSNQAEFFILDISNPNNMNLLGSLNVNHNLYELVVDNNYAYIGSDDPNGQLKVIDVSNSSSPNLLSSFNLPGNEKAFAISILSNYLFIGQESNLQIVDISNPINPSLISSLNVSGSIHDISLNLANQNNYLFLITDNKDNNFQVIDIEDISSPTVLSSLAIDNDLNGLAYNKNNDLVIIAASNNNEQIILINTE